MFVVKGVDAAMCNSVRPADEIERVVKKYSNMLFRICLVMLCREQDAEDALQDTFLKYISKAPAFNDAEHQKAWLIRVATNICNDMGRFRLRHNHVNINDLSDYYETEESADILEAVLLLPQKYKIVIHLHYVEGYDMGSISEITGISIAATKKRLQRGREMLKLEYRKGRFLNERKSIEKSTC